MKLPNSYYNYISFFGSLIAGFSFVLIAFLWVITHFFTGGGMYLGMFIYIVIPIFRNFVPYLVVFVFFAAAVFLMLWGKPFNVVFRQGAPMVLVHGSADVAVQFLLIIMARGLGLFYKHYNCNLSW